MANVYNSITELVGKTPMVRLEQLEQVFKLKARLFGKCEFYNPLFSVKDRIALSMVERLEKENKITEDTILVEATSGNTGVGLAAICAAKGYKLVITMPDNMSASRVKLLEHFGAELILTPAEEGMDGAIKKAEFLAEKNPRVILVKQFENPANPDAHRFSTSVEIIDDMDGEIDALVVGIGTAGTLNGVASVLKSYNPDLYVMAVEPKASNVLNGGKANEHKISGIGAGFIPKFYDKSLVDEVFDVEDDAAINMAHEVAKTEGLPVGISAGAVLFAAIDLGQRKEMKDRNIVIILPDSIERNF